MHILDIFDAKLLPGKLPIAYTRIEIDPTILASGVSSVYSSITTDREERKLNDGKKARNAFTTAANNFVSVVNMGFRANVDAPFMQPDETEKLSQYYLQDLDLLNDTAEDVITELNQLDKVNENDNDLVDENTLNDDLQIPSTLVHPGARPKVSAASTTTTASSTILDPHDGASAPAVRV